MKNDAPDLNIVRRLQAAGCPMPGDFDDEWLPDLTVEVTRKDWTKGYDRPVEAEFVFAIRINNHSFRSLRIYEFSCSVRRVGKLNLLADPRTYLPNKRKYRMPSGREFPCDIVLNHFASQRVAIIPGGSAEGVLLAFSDLRRIPDDLLHDSVTFARISITDQFNRTHPAEIEILIDRTATMRTIRPSPRGPSLYDPVESPTDGSVHEPTIPLVEDDSRSIGFERIASVSRAGRRTSIDAEKQTRPLSAPPHAIAETNNEEAPIAY